MSIVKINAITVADGDGAELERRFLARESALGDVDGFEGFTLLRPTGGESRWFVHTRWRDQEAYDAWRNSEAFGSGHGRRDGPAKPGDAPASRVDHAAARARATGKRPVAISADLLEFDVVLEAGFEPPTQA